MIGRILRLFPWFCLLLAMGCNQAPPPVARAQTEPTDNAQMQPMANAQMQPADDAQMQPMANAQMQPADGAQMQPAAKPQMRPPDKGTVRVRVGEHGGFDRIVFDWSSRVVYRVESKSGLLTVIFERPARFDLSGYRENPPPFFRSIKTRSEGEGIAVDVEIPQGTTLRHFMSGNSVVLDVLAPGTPKDAPAANAEPAKPAKALAARAPKASAPKVNASEATAPKAKPAN